MDWLIYVGIVVVTATATLLISLFVVKQQFSKHDNEGGISDEKMLLLFRQLETRLQSFEMGNEQKMDNMRNTLKEQLQAIQHDNNEKLEKMRQTVNEKYRDRKL